MIVQDRMVVTNTKRIRRETDELYRPCFNELSIQANTELKERAQWCDDHMVKGIVAPSDIYQRESQRLVLRMWYIAGVLSC